MRTLAIMFFLCVTATTPAIAQSVSTLPPSAMVANQGQNNTPPATQHTGWSSLIKDTAQDFLAFPKRKSTWVILAAGSVGALATHPADDYVQEHVVGNSTAQNVFKLGKFVGSTYVQVGTAVGLWVAGRYFVAPATDQSKTNKLSHLGFDLMRAQIVSQGLVHAIKYTARRDRPTGECCAFPSGHATTAFATAAVLERHFGYRGSWPAILGATYVAASRLVDNRHFLSDVVFGAALGEATGWTIVGRHGRSQYTMQPVPVRGGMMVALVRVNE
jgi:membrane-associated phospholipid phosphatase